MVADGHMSFSLSIVMMAYNEAENIGPVVGEVVDDLEETVSRGTLSDYQLVLVDDGSTDETGRIIDDLASRNRRILPMSHGTNRGMGAAVLTGFAAARMDVLGILPADGQVAFSELRKLVPSIEDGADMAVGYFTRTQRAAVDGPFRMVLSRGLHAMMRVAIGTSRRIDGVYLVRRAILKEVPLTSRTFFVNLELPMRLVRGGYDVRSIPVELRPRMSGASKVLGIRPAARVGSEVLKLRLNLVLEALETRAPGRGGRA
jgi:glycosyltransferase involved in cell wall biosynthesis